MEVKGEMVEQGKKARFPPLSRSSPRREEKSLFGGGARAYFPNSGWYLSPQEKSFFLGAISEKAIHYCYSTTPITRTNPLPFGLVIFTRLTQTLIARISR